MTKFIILMFLSNSALHLLLVLYATWKEPQLRIRRWDVAQYAATQLAMCAGGVWLLGEVA